MKNDASAKRFQRIEMFGQHRPVVYRNKNDFTTPAQLDDLIKRTQLMFLRRGYLILLFTIHFSLFTFFLHAQQAWTVQQCIDYDLSHNITIKQSELNVELNKSLTMQSTANLFPTLNGFASNNYYYG